MDEFINSFIDLNRKNQASLEALKESYHEADLKLYHILRSSNGQVDSTRLLDIIQTIIAKAGRFDHIRPVRLLWI